MNREVNKIQKRLRAMVIADYLRSTGTNDCVCFSCGNASRYLKEEGLNVVEVIAPEKWYEFKEIREKYKVFDATSGHLPLPLMRKVASMLREYLGPEPGFREVACGSGETIVCLAMAYPHLKFKPVYDLDAPTKFNQRAPLNDLVESLTHGPE